MPILTIEYSDADHTRLQEEYIKMSIVWPQLGNKDLPPTFEAWVASRAVEGDGSSISLDIADMHLINAVEKFIVSLEPHDFGLTHLSRDPDHVQEAILQLANALVSELHLQPQCLRRVQNLIEQHLRSPREISDSAHIGVTSRTHGALDLAYHKLIERTAKALSHLGEDRAVGRVEGAGAILASLHIIDRNTAEERTEAFRLQARAGGKPSWVGKVFRRGQAQDASKKE
ncbi:hypothetical protein BH11PSE11_BH11PSE11_22700 [soil metagenome]